MTDQRKWYVDERALYLRAWSWAWKIPPNRADLCSLFWGLLFIWMPVLGRAVRWLTWPIWKPLTLATRWCARTYRARKTLARQRRIQKHVALMDDPLKAPKPQREHRLLDFIVDTSARVATWFAGRRWIGEILLALGLVVCGVTALALVGYGLYLGIAALLTLPGSVWLMVGGAAAGIAVCFLVGMFLVSRFDVLFPARAVGRGTAGFFRIMFQGAMAVKHRTCPKVEVVPREMPR